jgi:hypothetical protein
VLQSDADIAHSHRWTVLKFGLSLDNKVIVKVEIDVTCRGLGLHLSLAKPLREHFDPGIVS